MTDPILGEAGRLFTSGANCWAAFTRDFSPTESKVTVLADVVAGSVPSSAVDLYRQIEARYSALFPEIVRSVCSKMALAPATVERGFELDTIDLRGHLRPSACVLHYRTDLEFEWYARISHDYRVEFCGERD